MNYRKFTFVLAAALAVSPVSSVIPGAGDTGLITVQAAKSTAKKKTTAKKKGWVTTKKGKIRYFKKGTFVTGIQKIKGKYYYFNDAGALKKGTTKAKNITYYSDENGVLEAYQKKSTYYFANGKKMNKVETEDFKTLQTARSIVKKITTSKMSQAQKLKTCFDWVISKPYMTRRTFSNTAGWPAVYANDHFLLGGGNCFADAAAFAYLAKALGYKNIYVCVDCDGSGGRGHSWAEVDGLVYDPLFAEAKDYASYYGVPYSSYALSPILHIAV